MFAVRDAPGDKRCINPGLWIFQQLKIFDSSGLHLLQIDVFTREPVPIPATIIIEGSPFESRCEGHGRWWSRKKINEYEAHNGHDNGDGDKAGK